nr:hypothetical protein [Mycolicibacterium sp. GF69]
MPGCAAAGVTPPPGAAAAGAAWPPADKAGDGLAGGGAEGTPPPMPAVVATP